MTINSKIMLFSVIICSSLSVQASSVTTLLQCAVPVASGVTGYLSMQDLKNCYNFQENLPEQKQQTFVDKSEMGSILSIVSIGGSIISSIIAASSACTDQPTSAMLLGASTATLGLSVYYAMQGHQVIQHAKDEMNALARNINVVDAIPNNMHIELQQDVVRSQETLRAKQEIRPLFP